ncbi:MAG: beta-galactosidase [Anaerolineales bacterium]|nr:beta-galactosidase [Anaerolineales bacterium]
MKQSKFYFGVDYYPEHWPGERWPEDARLMAEAGINIVRMAEFAWSKMEPEDGRYEFGWLDRAISILDSQGIRVILGTPTASPPPWLMMKQDDLFLVNQDGRRLTYGNRRVYCPNNPLYHAHSRKIVEKMAVHYKDHPSVVGWQIDNEFGSRCFCGICRAKFHTWLQAHYDSIDEVNQKWGTVFWSHGYNDWSEVPVPLSTGNSPNPGLALDYYRFMSDSYKAYQRAQVNILRENCPDDFITHNLMGFRYEFINYFDLVQDLDFVSWDIYLRTQWNMKAKIDPSWAALGHDAMRGLKDKNYWVMEQQAGPGGWEIVSAPPKPGELRLWTYQSIAHGSDGILYFRWRSCRFGIEQFWHGILDHHGIPGRRFTEISQVGMELGKVGEIIAGSQIKAQVAIMQSYDSRFAFQVQSNNPCFRYEAHIQDIYSGFYNHNIAVDVISENNPLTGYKVVIVPAMFVLSEQTAVNLERFASDGGVVVFTPRTGVKDESNKVTDVKLPGRVARMAGVEIEEYISMPIDEDNRVRFILPNLEEEFTASVWADVLKPITATPVARYSSDYYAGQAAVTINAFDEGQVIYIGTLGDASFYENITKWVLDLADIKPLLDTPKGVEVTERWQGEQRLLFVLNHTGEKQMLELTKGYKDLLSDALLPEGFLTIESYAVLILTPEAV